MHTGHAALILNVLLIKHTYVVSDMDVTTAKAIGSIAVAIAIGYIAVAIISPSMSCLPFVLPVV